MVISVIMVVDVVVTMLEANGSKKREFGVWLPIVLDAVEIVALVLMLSQKAKSVVAVVEVKTVVDVAEAPTNEVTAAVLARTALAMLREAGKVLTVRGVGGDVLTKVVVVLVVVWVWKALARSAAAVKTV